MSTNRLALVVATFFGAGRFPIAPGTAGSAAALAPFLLVRWYGAPWIEAAVLVAVSAAGVWSAGVTERALGTTDPGLVVVDEVAGMLLTLLWLPVGVWGVVAGFALFRLFDIIKPYPCGRLERLDGGLGIMADDLMAGLYGQVSLRILLALFPALG